LKSKSVKKNEKKTNIVLKPNHKLKCKVNPNKTKTEFHNEKQKIVTKFRTKL